MIPVTEPAQDEQASAPPALAAPFALPTIKELAANPPPRRWCQVKNLPPQAECETALDLEPGDPADTLLRVFIAARIHREGGAVGRLAFDLLFGGELWPAEARAALLTAYPLMLHFEHRLAAIEHRRATERRGPPPLTLDVR